MKYTIFLMLILFPLLCFAQDDDSDGVITEYCEPVDNCPFNSNPDQSDCDSDGVGDVCDADPGCPDTDTGTVADTGSDTDTDTGLAVPVGCGQTNRFDQYFSIDADDVLSIADNPYQRDPDVFIVLGDSHSERPSTTSYPQNYFLGNCYYYPWGDAIANYTAGLKDAQCFPFLYDDIEDYIAATGSGASPLMRVHTTASGGQKSSWLVGSPSTLDGEIAATNPMAALVMFGTNDPLLSTNTPEATVSNLLAIAAHLIDRGVVPIIFSPPFQYGYPLYMDELADLLEAACEAAGVPFVDFYGLTMTLSNYGLRDTTSVHLYAPRWNGKCSFDLAHLGDDAIPSGENYHTLFALIALHTVREIAQ